MANPFSRLWGILSLRLEMLLDLVSTKQIENIPPAKIFGDEEKGVELTIQKADEVIVALEDLIKEHTKSINARNNALAEMRDGLETLGGLAKQTTDPARRQVLEGQMYEQAEKIVVEEGKVESLQGAILSAQERIKNTNIDIKSAQVILEQRRLENKLVTLDGATADLLNRKNDMVDQISGAKTSPATDRANMYRQQVKKRYDEAVQRDRLTTRSEQRRTEGSKVTADARVKQLVKETLGETTEVTTVQTTKGEETAVSTRKAEVS